jgi:TfoX/Sxy family transcriptional regulator of competence genes
MASDQRTVDFIVEQLAPLGVSARKMFGEYGLSLDGKSIGVICDNQLFVKPTEAGRAFLGEVAEAPPYPGAKPSFVIDPDRWDDADWLVELVRITADALPAPKPKKPKRS